MDLFQTLQVVNTTCVEFTANWRDGIAFTRGDRHFLLDEMRTFVQEMLNLGFEMESAGTFEVVLLHRALDINVYLRSGDDGICPHAIMAVRNTQRLKELREGPTPVPAPKSEPEKYFDRFQLIELE